MEYGDLYNIVLTMFMLLCGLQGAMALTLFIIVHLIKEKLDEVGRKEYRYKMINFLAATQLVVVLLLVYFIIAGPMRSKV